MSTNAINGNSPPIPQMTNSPQLEASLNPTQDFGTRIRSIAYDAPAFKNAEEFRAAFEEAEKGAHGAANAKFKAEGDLVLYVAKIQSYLSERGANAHLRKAAGIPAGFEHWYTEFRAQYDVEYAFKTIQHKIAQLHGGCEHCGRLAENDADHKKSCILYRPLIELADPGENCDRPELDMKQLTTAHLADRYMAMVGLLTNAPKDATPQEIIATMRAEAETAYEELDAEMAQKIRVPKLVKLPDPDYANLKNEIQALKAENDSLKQRLQASMKEVPEALRDDRITGELAAEPDRGKAAYKLQEYLQTVGERILPPRMSLISVTVNHLRLEGRGYRIEVGDWLEKENRDAGGLKTLAKCTATAYSNGETKRKVREWVAGKWGRERTVCDNHVDYKVVSEQAARALAPQSFAPGALADSPQTPSSANSVDL
jgi:hypothetical protein